MAKRLLQLIQRRVSWYLPQLTTVDVVVLVSAAVILVGCLLAKALRVAARYLYNRFSCRLQKRWWEEVEPQANVRRRRRMKPVVSIPMLPFEAAEQTELPSEEQALPAVEEQVTTQTSLPAESHEAPPRAEILLADSEESAADSEWQVVSAGKRGDLSSESSLKNKLRRVEEELAHYRDSYNAMNQLNNELKERCSLLESGKRDLQSATTQKVSSLSLELSSIKSSLLRVTEELRAEREADRKSPDPLQSHLQELEKSLKDSQEKNRELAAEKEISEHALAAFKQRCKQQKEALDRAGISLTPTPTSSPSNTSD